MCKGQRLVGNCADCTLCRLPYATAEDARAGAHGAQSFPFGSLVSVHTLRDDNVISTLLRAPTLAICRGSEPEHVRSLGEMVILEVYQTWPEMW